MPNTPTSSIKSRLIRINMLITGAALLLASGAFLYFEVSAVRQTMVRNLVVQARIASANTSSALVFDDANSATVTLSALAASPNVEFAGIYKPGGKLFASYRRDKAQAAPPPPALTSATNGFYRFTSSDLSLAREIIFQGKLVGSIYIRTDLGELADQIQRFGGIFGAVLALSLAVALALSAKLQNAIAHPIVQLAGVARAVSRQKRFSVGSPSTGGMDEVAILIDAFNEMLAEIQTRDAALESAHERLNLALRSANIGTWSVSEGVVTWDDFMYPLFGLQLGEFAATYEGFIELILPNDRELIRRVIGDSFDIPAPETEYSDNSYDIEFRVRWANGEVHTLTSRGRVYRNGNSRPVRMTGVCWDVTARKKSEEERRKFVSLVEQTDDFVAMIGLDLMIIYMNRAGQALVGLDGASTPGRPLSDVHPEEWTARLTDEIFPGILNGGKNWVGEGQLRDVRTDQPIDVLMNIFPVTDPDTRQLVCFAAVTRDITERKRLEEQLRQAQKLESVGQLAGGVAHDFNNLLTVIIGYGELILADLPPGSAMRESVLEIYQAAQRASALTRQLLAFSRRQMSEPRVININHLIGNVEKMLRRVIGEEIDLTVNLDENAGFLRADPGHIEQVIMNLVINARDAMPGGGKLTIETSRLFVDEDFAEMHVDSTRGENVLLSVTDTGTGMTPEVRARIFEPFFTTKETGKGTGLGLSTAYGIVKQSGGAIWVYSEPGGGSMFTLLFPAVEDPDREADETTYTPGMDGRLYGNETILVAEDEDGVRTYVRQILERNGYTVLEAAEGSEAIDIIKRTLGPIHLLLTDVVMREMGGVELAECFSRLRPGVPYLYMSGYNEHFWFHEDMSANLIQKPFTAISLLRRIRRVLDDAA